MIPLVNLYFQKLHQKERATQLFNQYETLEFKRTADYYKLKGDLSAENNVTKCTITLPSYKKALQYGENKYLEYAYIHLLSSCQQEGLALTQMEKFVKRHPNKIAYRKELAYLHEKAKNYPKAIENYKLVEAHEPKEKRYKTDLAIAYAYKKTGKAQEAKHYFKQAIDHAPNLNEKQLSYIRNEIVNNNRAFHFYLAQSFRLDNYKNGSNASSIINGATYAGFGDLQLSYQPSSFSKKVELFGELSHGHKKGEVVSSIQPSIGVRVHSLKKHNITLSAQQLIKRSDNTRNETLLRAAIGISSSPQTALNQNLYLESAYFIRNRATILYGNYEVGKNYKINHNLKIKPYLTAGGSYNNDNAHKNAITNLDVGVGVALKIKPHDSKYEPAPYSNKLKLEARKKYAGNTKDDKTIRLQWELFY